MAVAYNMANLGSSIATAPINTAPAGSSTAQPGVGPNQDLRAVTWRREPAASRMSESRT